MRFFRLCCRFALAVGMVLSLGTTTMAQDYDWRAVLSQSVKVQMEINRKFEFSKERQVSLHFTMGIPFFDGELITRTRFLSKEGNLGEILFMSPDEQLLEFVTVSTGTVGGDTNQERLERLFSVIEGQVYPTLTPPPTANILGGRIVDIAGHPAVEFVALFDDADNGNIAARIVGVISPNNKDVVFVVQQTMRDTLGLSGLDEMALTFGGSMLTSLTFQAYRDEDGSLVDF